MLKQVLPALAATGLVFAAPAAFGADNVTARAAQIAAADPAAIADAPKVTKHKLHPAKKKPAHKAAATAKKKKPATTPAGAVPAAAPDAGNGN